MLLTSPRYACTYRCPHVFAFDGCNLVIVQFKASRFDDILQANCRIDCCVIPHPIGRGIAGLCTMQYALYRLAWRGWVRLCATTECVQDRRSGRLIRSKREVIIDGRERDYRGYSGEPFWRDVNGDLCNPPRGWWRDFANRSYQRQDGSWKSNGYWFWTNGRDEIKDTSNCLLYCY